MKIIKQLSETEFIVKILPQSSRTKSIHVTHDFIQLSGVQGIESDVPLDHPGSIGGSYLPVPINIQVPIKMASLFLNKHLNSHEYLQPSRFDNGDYSYYSIPIEMNYRTNGENFTMVQFPECDYLVSIDATYYKDYKEMLLLLHNPELYFSING